MKYHVEKWLSEGWKNWLFIPSLSSSVTYMIILDPILYEAFSTLLNKTIHCFWEIEKSSPTAVDRPTTDYRERQNTKQNKGNTEQRKHRKRNKEGGNRAVIVLLASRHWSSGEVSSFGPYHEILQDYRTIYEDSSDQTWCSWNQILCSSPFYQDEQYRAASHILQKPSLDHRMTR